MERPIKKFGDFIKEKRLSRGITLREMSEEIEISLSFLCDIESNRRKPFEGKKLEKLIQVLNLTEEDQHTCYDLAGRDNGEKVPADIENIFMYSPIGNLARLALRKSKDGGEINIEDWEKFLKGRD